MTMTQSINPATKAKLEELKAEIARAATEPEPAAPSAAELEHLKAKATAAVDLILVRDAEALERLADA